MSNDNMTRPTGAGISLIVSGLVLDFALRHIWQFDDVSPGVGIFGCYFFLLGIFLLVGSAWSWFHRRREANFLIRLSLSDRQSARRQTLAIFQPAEYRSCISRRRLRKRLSTLPHFGLFAAITLAIGAVIPMYVLEFCFRPVPKGIPISLLRDVVSMTSRFREAVPIVVRLKDMGYDADPNLYLNSKLVTWADLPYELRKELLESPDRTVYVRGDDNISFLNVVSVMDIIRGEHAKVVLLTPRTEELLPARHGDLAH